MESSKFSPSLNTLIDRSINKFAPPEDINVWQWADKYRYLPEGTSARPGQYESAYTIYWRRVMEAFTDPNIKTIVIKAAAQTAKTDIFTNYCGFRAHLKPTHIYIVLPDEKTFADFSTNKLQPMFDHSPALAGLLRDAAPGKSGSTERRKLFPGGSITFATANSPADMRSRSVEVGIIDELDAIPRKIANEGSIVSLLENRTNTYAATKKLIYVSTPTDEASQIQELYLNGTQEKFHVPCPHCGHLQTLEFENIEIPKEEEGGKFITDKARYRCSECASLWNTQEKDAAVLKGIWIPTELNPVSKSCASFEFSGLASPMHSLESVAERWAVACKDPEKKKTFWNTVLGRVWLENLTKPDHIKLQNRAEKYDPTTLIVPKDVLLIVGGVDVQRDRLALTIWGYGKGQESWLLYWGEIGGNTLQEEVWAKLDTILKTEFRRGDENGAPLSIEACAIDSNDWHSHQAVLTFCRERTDRNVFPIEGSNQTWGKFIKRPNKQDINLNGQVIKEGIEVWGLGTASIKEFLYGRLKLEETGPGFVHTYATARNDFWEQLTVETLRIKEGPRGSKTRYWDCPSHKRNEALDCTVYALAAAYRCGADQIGYFENRLKDILEVELTSMTTKQVVSSGDTERKGRRIVKSNGLTANTDKLPVNEHGNKTFTTTTDFEGTSNSNNWITGWK